MRGRDRGRRKLRRTDDLVADDEGVRADEDRTGARAGSRERNQLGGEFGIECDVERRVGRANDRGGLVEAIENAHS